MKGKESVGIDIGSTGVRAARVSMSGKDAELEAFRIEPLEPGAVKDGEVADQEAVAKAVGKAYARVGKSKKVAVAVANQKVVARIAELPYMEERELRSAIRYQVQDLIPIPLDSAVLDFQVLQEFTNEEQQRMVRALVVAAHKEMIAAFLETLEKAAITVEGIDFTPLTLVRSLRAPSPGTNGGPDSSEKSDSSQALIDVGSELISMVVHQNSVPKLARVLAVGGNEEAETLVEEIRGSIQYYMEQSDEGNISSVLISGEAKDLPMLCGLLQDSLNLPVRVGSGLQAVKASKKTVRAIDDKLAESMMAVAIGTALGVLEA